MKTYLFFIMLLCLTAGALQAQEEATPEPTAEAEPEFPSPGSFTAAQRAAGLIRNYEIYIPQNYDNAGEPVALVIVLHGAGGTGRAIESFSGFDDVADREGFIVVYPDSSRFGWNDNRGDASLTVDDLVFMERIIDYFVENVNVDPARVYAGGFSRGGMLAFRIGCKMRDKIAAVVSVASSLPSYLMEECGEADPIPVMLIHGTLDNVIFYEGMPGYLSADDTIEFWVEQNECETPADITESLDENEDDETSVEIQTYNQCADDAEVTFYSVTGGGHNWPGHIIPTNFDLGPTSQEFDAAEVMWEFFQRH